LLFLCVCLPWAPLQGPGFDRFCSQNPVLMAAGFRMQFSAGPPVDAGALQSLQASS
jgi:hypothetical protein